jgi:hypothetical protein
MATNNAINIVNAGICKYDGAGTFSAITVTNHNVLLGAASNGITSLALTNGQLAIGSTGADPSAANITAGTGISITNGAGSITINGVGSGLTWTKITADQTGAVNNGYILNKAGVLTLTMPSTAAIGDVIAVININTAASGKILSANPGQLQLGSSLATANTGSFTSTALGDTMYLVCTTANTTWYAIGVTGNWTVA